MENTTIISTIAISVALTAIIYKLSTNAYQRGLRNLRDFQLSRILNVSDFAITILGSFANDTKAQDAIIIIRNRGFEVSTLDSLLKGMSLHTISLNNIYSYYNADVSCDIKPFKVDLIYPATEGHIQKYTAQTFHMIVETKEIYNQITRPYIESIPVEKIAWVYNILEHQSEVDRIIFEDSDPTNGFILLPDSKWNSQSNVEALYCLALVHDRKIRSVRDLRGHHIQLLKNIRDTSLRVIKEKYGLNRNAVRIYVHYQPTYYHFHVHFSHVKLMNGVHIGKAIGFDDIIQNLQINDKYYENAALTYVVGEMQHKALFTQFCEANYL